MHSWKSILSKIPFAIALVCLWACGDTPDHDAHAGHDHETSTQEQEGRIPPAGETVDAHAGHDHAKEEPVVDPHAGHDHGPGELHEEPAAPVPDDHAEEDGHDDHAEKGDDDDHAQEVGDDDHEDDGHEPEDHVELTAAQQERIGLKLVEVGPGSLAVTAAFPGTVEQAPEGVVHVVPRAAGVVVAVEKTLGDRINAGEVLAWIDSNELAEAKLAYFAKLAEVGCCEVQLPRARQIHANVTRLLAVLAKDPDAADLEPLAGLEMGEWRGTLLSARADLVNARQALVRDRSLHGKGIVSDEDLFTAQAEFRKVEATYAAATDTARFQVLVDFGEAAQARQVVEFEAVAAEQRLRLFGVDDAGIAALAALVPKIAGVEPCTCDDPDCQEGKIPSVLDTLGKRRDLGRCAVVAPRTGVISARQLAVGEQVGGEELVFAITDTSRVWFRFGVYQKDLAVIAPGQSVSIDFGHGIGRAEGTVSSLAPTVDPETRTVAARVILDNPKGHLRPGLYGTARVAVDQVAAQVVVPREAVQVLGKRQVVFVAEGDGFSAVPVTLGHGDRRTVAVTAGLAPGQRVVTAGAFELKAKLATSGMDAHAGHGH